ncbi:hypothetical protein [Daejeonella sp.]|jgi:hypothetical protein|uniref:hypothetical protein n=1 Tax=Daejeonella sp. TaxID=2805397 RepID=UPI003783A599
MKQEQTNNSELYEEEFSFKNVISKWIGDIKYLFQFKKLFILVAAIGILGGSIAAWLWPITYSSRTSFIIEDTKAGGGSLLAGLAGQIGLDIGGAMGGTSGVLAGDNVLALLRSDQMIKSTLITPYQEQGEKTLADVYAESNKLKESWAKYNQGKLISFPQDRKVYNRLQDSLLQDMVIRIAEKNLSVSKPDKKLGFFQLIVTMPDEQLSQLFSLRIIDKATEFYVYTKTKSQRTNVERLQARADSIERLLNRKTYSASAANRVLLDANPAFPTANPGIELQQRDKMVLQSIYGEILKNLEIGRTVLIQETPTFQIVDKPELPLQKNKLKYSKAMVLGAFFSLFFLALYLLAFRKRD